MCVYRIRDLHGGIDLSQHIKCLVVLFEFASHGQIATVYEKVRGRQRRFERCDWMPCIVFSAQGRIMGIADDENSSFHG